MQKDAQLIDIRCRRQGFAENLLRRRIARCQSDFLDTRQLRSLFECYLGTDQFGDSKVEQFDDALGGHQYIRRFDVAMDDQVRMGMRNGTQHIHEKLHSGPRRE
jgi:hypothetical protein